MIDRDGFRPNVGIILINQAGEVFWGKRAGHRSWQFPQGGINEDERPLTAMFRELHEETGLLPSDVEVIGWTCGWLRYRLPKNMIRRHLHPTCIGQKQKWFLLRLRSSDSAFNLNATSKPEFDGWEWRPYWSILSEVIYFKRAVYRTAMSVLAPTAGAGEPPAETDEHWDGREDKESAHVG
ncbi:RNA pyrophosphohydrolase [Halothiobacillus diazotrophicus]|uniref:RNA pyrophosphohydrolase n=1 Tax=Halothiobacillus diazotrophicus TaxID=1860122 RepID=A0A191ZDT4_9GAMM|nr:RNA pyrophosphohydrolase [Halothiobacillus diazotrophicus]ANJ66027.1 RNA pyrophosphohydrolase [Halothiobacillus diazotrophicus]